MGLRTRERKMRGILFPSLIRVRKRSVGGPPARRNDYFRQVAGSPGPINLGLALSPPFINLNRVL